MAGQSLVGLPSAPATSDEPIRRMDASPRLLKFSGRLDGTDVISTEGFLADMGRNIVASAARNDYPLLSGGVITGVGIEVPQNTMATGSSVDLEVNGVIEASSPAIGA
jgi:hypothetical protein